MNSGFYNGVMDGLDVNFSKQTFMQRTIGNKRRDPMEFKENAPVK